MDDNAQLEVSCPGCGRPVKYSSAAASQPVECPECKKKFEPASVKASAVTPASGANPAPESAQAKLVRTTKDIDWTDLGTKPKRRRTSPWIAVFAVSTLALAVVLLLLARQQPSATTAGDRPVVAAAPPEPVTPAVHTPSGASNFPSPPAYLPPARVKTPKSLNDLKIGNFVLNERRPGEEFIVISGDVENVSDNLHRRVKVDLEVLDARGLRIGTLSDFVTELPARSSWHVLGNTTNARAASVRLIGIKED